MLPRLSTLLAVGSLLSPVSIVRADIPPGTLGVYVCDEANWQGFCTWTMIPTFFYETCTPLGNRGKGFGSVGPDDGLIIRVYADSGCQTQVYANLVYPGEPNFASFAHHGPATTQYWIEADLLSNVGRPGPTAGAHPMDGAPGGNP